MAQPYDSSQRFKTPDINPLLDALFTALSGGQKSAQQPQQPPQTPAGDMRPIVATASPTSFSPPTGYVQGTPEQTNFPTALPAIKTPQLDDNGQTTFGRLLSRLGLPLLSTGVGMAVPGALAGASGFNTGYSGEVAKDREMERKQKLNQGFKDTYTFDPDTGEYTATGVKIPKNAQVRNLTSDQQMQLNDKINALLGMDEAKTGDAIKGAQQKTKEVQGNVPAGAAHYSPSTKKYYNAQGQEL